MILIPRSRVLGCLLALMIPSEGAFSQKADSATCRSVLSNPVRDSLTMTVGVVMSSFDPSITLRAGYRYELAAALRGELHVPTPLPLTIYSVTGLGKKASGSDSTSVIPSILGAYAARLLPTGRMDNIRVVGGAHGSAFDDAFLRALHVLSDSGLLPLREEPVLNDTIDLRFSVFPKDVVWPGGSGFEMTVYPMEPLFRVRVPALGEGKTPASVLHNVPPRYPEAARARGDEGEVRLRFVVGADGRGELDSIEILEATSKEFAAAVLAAFPTLSFYPLELRGCPLRSAAQMPFEFRLRY